MKHHVKGAPTQTQIGAEEVRTDPKSTCGKDRCSGIDPDSLGARRGDTTRACPQGAHRRAKRDAGREYTLIHAPGLRRPEVQVCKSGVTQIRISGREIRRMVLRARADSYTCPLKWFLSYAICRAQGMPMLPESRWTEK